MSRERFMVAESSGYTISASGATSTQRQTEVMVLDRAYCHRVVWSSLTTVMPFTRRYFNKDGPYRKWRTHHGAATARFWPLAKRRRYAADLAARLNAEHG